ncbi:peptidase M12 [Pseudomonas fluorescens]|uniref:Peptidase M12 n=1 Tax=Pseudomonas fluorescens TaxID=294 RepID=A0A345USR4_PSEFL|nr:M12 family metallopeptidase [Pseudomonas fluorescens]AXJ03516.1 peptidase M12 [Pseudomonas fluorescens]WJK11061.1 M12 family metallopeptidase [Pseudomonas fluorescens]
MPYQPPCKTINNFDEQASYDAAIIENPANAITSSSGGRTKRAVATHSKFWASHRTLKIAFLNPPSEAHRQAAIAAIKQWQPSVNLTLEFVSDTEGDIRITMEATSDYSAIGTDATLRGPGENTMNIGTDLTHPGFESAVLHEFGHALGMEHEHQHPESNIPWNKPFMYHYYLTRHNWPKEQVDHNFFRTLDTTTTKTNPYDPKSIMHYAVHTDMTLGDFSIAKNTTISQNDRRLMRRIYPKQ